MAAALLVVEKVGVIIAGGGIGLVLFGLNWQKPPTSRPPLAIYRGNYQHSARNIRWGSLSIAVGGPGAGLAYLASLTFR
jgi:hypothetical protein